MRKIRREAGLGLTAARGVTPRAADLMRIRTEMTPIGWRAIDDDTFDGAPDAGPRAQIMGEGRTEAEAIADLKRQVDEME